MKLMMKTPSKIYLEVNPNETGELFYLKQIVLEEPYQLIEEDDITELTVGDIIEHEDGTYSIITKTF
jgi:hypothetical protein